MKYLEAEHPGLYERLILSGTLYRHLADANERATSMLERLVEQMAAQEGITENFKETQPLEWVCRMNNIRSRAEEIILHIRYYHNDYNVTLEEIIECGKLWCRTMIERRSEKTVIGLLTYNKKAYD